MDFIKADSTNQSILFHLKKGGLAVTGFKIGFVRWNQGDGTSFAETGPTALTALATVTTAHSDNKGIYLDTDTSGGSYFLFRADFPDAAFASGADQVICHLYDDGNNVIAQRIFMLGYLSVSVSAMASDTITAAAIATDAVDADAIKADAITEIQSGLATEAKQDIIDGVVDSILSQGVIIDAIVDAIKVQTDKLVFTVANKVDANIHYVNDVEVDGDGETGTEWGPA